MKLSEKIAAFYASLDGDEQMAFVQKIVELKQDAEALETENEKLKGEVDHLNEMVHHYSYLAKSK